MGGNRAFLGVICVMPRALPVAARFRRMGGTLLRVACLGPTPQGAEGTKQAKQQAR
jgi:hypothetical protein